MPRTFQTDAEKKAYWKAYWSNPVNKERKKKNAHKSYIKNRDKCKRRMRSRSLIVKYGITDRQYCEKLNSQHGVCKICGRPPLCKKLAVDHSHKTGKVRGLLCSQCNQILGLASDEPTILRLAAIYLEENSNE